ncbi:MAG: pentapeptide repeat-containing protein [Planctomycetes bacterium]|nr:pentapeptide repeat-containing protein [Planctomycetota bacterium]
MDTKTLLAWLKSGDYISFNDYRSQHPDDPIILSNKDEPADLRDLRIPLPSDTRQVTGPLNLRDAQLDFADLSGSVFNAGCVLTGASLKRAKLSGASLQLNPAPLDGTDFSGADLSLCDFGGSIVGRAIFIGTKGLYGPRKARDIGQWKHTEEAVVRRRWESLFGSQLFAWDKMRTIRSLHLRAASYFTFLIIVIYVGVARWYQHEVDALQDWARQHMDDDSSALTAWIAAIPDNLPVPSPFVLQLFAIVFLAVAATIYSYACPDIIQEWSRTKWVDEQDEAELEYRAAAFGYRWWRYICAFFYWPGALYTIYYLISRGFDTLVFLLSLRSPTAA